MLEGASNLSLLVPVGMSRVTNVKIGWFGFWEEGHTE